MLLVDICTFFIKNMHFCSKMAPILVTITADSHQDCVKICARHMRAATENGSCDDDDDGVDDKTS